MAHRASILLDDELYARYQRRARRRRTTLSDAIRETLRNAPDDENPNQWLLDLSDEFNSAEFTEGPSVDSDEFKEEMVRQIYRDSFNREPDW